MRMPHIVQVIIIIASTSVIHVIHSQTVIPSTGQDGLFNTATQSTSFQQTTNYNFGQMSAVRTKGLCRDGWTRGSMRDVSGANIPICLRVNSKPQTWDEAKSSCRKEYGFLLKLDSVAKWEENELLSVLFEQGITKTWTGIHTVYNRLVWDDLIPSQVSPSHGARNSSSSLRPWQWDSRRFPKLGEYCGYMDIKEDSNDRRKRAIIEDDNTDILGSFDFSNLGDRIMESSFNKPSPVINLPRTSAFKSMLARTQMSDQLPEIPSASLGLQSELQIPGTGLSEANLQEGGLSATIPPTLDSLLQSDKEENKDVVSGFDVSDSNLDSNKDITNPITANDDSQLNDFTALETLRDHFNEQSDLANSDSNSPVIDVINDVKEVPDSTFKFTTPSPLEAVNPISTDDDKNSDTKDRVSSLSDIADKISETVADPPAQENTESTTDVKAPQSDKNDTTNSLSDLIDIILDSGLISDNADTTSQSTTAETKLETSTSGTTVTVANNPTTTADTAATDTDEDENDKPKDIQNEATSLDQNTDMLEAIIPPTLSSDDKSDVISNLDISQVEESNDILKNEIDMPSDEIDTNILENLPSLDDNVISDNILQENLDVTDENTELPMIFSTREPSDMEISTENLPLDDDKFKNDDQPTSFNNPFLESSTMPEIDGNQDKSDEKEISDTLSDYLSHFKNTSDAEDNDDLRQEGTTLLPDDTNTGIDDVSEMYKDFIEGFPEKENDTVDDNAENDNLDDLSQIQDDGETLLESIRDTQNAILGKSDDTDNERHDSFGETTESNVDDHDLGFTESPHKEDDDVTEGNNFDDHIDDHLDFRDGSDTFEDKNEMMEKISDQIDDKFKDLDNLEHESFEYMNETLHDHDDNQEEHGSEMDNFPEIEQPSVNDSDNWETEETNKSGLEFDDYDEKGNTTEMDDYETSTKHGDILEHLDENDNVFDSNDDATDNAGKESDDSSDHLENMNNFSNDDYFENEQEDVAENVQEIEEEMRDLINMEEVVEHDNSVVHLERPKSDMVLGSCEARLPSVCFSYEVEVMTEASTCDEGWYGHVLLDTCFKILDQKLSYTQAEYTCTSLGARVVLGDSEFQRRFVLMAVQEDGKLFRGENFWKESLASQHNRCRYFNERESNVETSCDNGLRVVCIKDAKSLTVHTIHDDLGLDFDLSGNEEKLEFMSTDNTNVLQCDLTSAASEFPVLWFKDGVLVKTVDKYVAKDISLHMNKNLVDVISHVTNRNIAIPVLQGKYWCEVWDRKSLKRKRSTGYDVRYTDVISFHGSMELRGFTHKQEILFNMVNEKFESLSRTEMDIKRVFEDVLPRLQRYSPDVTSVYTYADGVRSRPKVIEYHTYFTLNRSYTVGDEDYLYNRLKALLRSQLGNRRYMAGLEGGTPLQAFRTMSLQSTVSCPATSLQTNRDLFGKTIPLRAFSFPKALMGEFANSINNCSERSGLPAGTARCLGDFQRGAYWGDVVANECTDERRIDDINEEIWGTSPFTQTLAKISELPVNKKNVQNVVQEIAHMADVAVKFTPTDINKIADILDHSTQIPDLPKKVGENVVRTVNRLMEMDEKEVHMANLETQAANRILKSVDRFADNLDLEKKENMRLVTDNVVVEIWDLKPDSRPVIGLAAETQIKDNLEKPFKTEKIATVFESSQLYDIDVDAAIELPKEVFSQREKGENIGSRLTMVVYRKSKLFDAAVRSKDNEAGINEKHFENLNSFIISASIAGKKIAGLTDKVRTIFRPIKDIDDTRKCVWWDFMKNDFKGGWSTRGCRYDGKMNGRDVCLCDHLTNFAVLLDFYGQAEPIDDHHELSLSIITVIGLSFSILGLSLTIISYVFFRKLRQGRAQQTLFNLSLALLFSMMTFLIGIKQTHNYYICVVVAVMLHYFILVSFMWMLMEAVLQYLTFVKILGTYITRFSLKTVLPAWGLPLLPVIAVLSINYDMYKGGPNYCWMSLQAFYYAFVIPISLIILINIVIFFITIISIFRRGKGLRSNQKKQKMALTNLQAAITSFILLGLTWIFGYLAISDARITFQYIFTILNSLQGFFIFVLFVLRKKKVRDQWYIICCKGSEKDRVSRSLSASNSIPSSCSSGSRNGRHKNERDRSDSTKTVQSTFSNCSTGSFTNYGYESGFDTPFNRHDKRFFRNF